MAVDVVTNDKYSVGAGDDEIRVGLTIGEGQFGSSRVSVGGKVLASGSGPMLVSLGKAKAVKGRSLVIRSAVSDVNSLTNKMSVTYRLTGGPSDLKSIARGTARQEGDLLVFDATFALS